MRVRHACNVALLGALLFTSQLALADDPPSAAPASPPAASAEPTPAAPPAPAEPTPNEEEAGPRPSMRWNAQPDKFPPPPPELSPNTTAAVTFESNGVPLHVRLEKADGAPSQFSCTTPCSLSVPIGSYFIHSEGDGLRTYDSPMEIRPNGFKMMLGAGRKKDFHWALALMGVAAAGIVGWSAVYVPQIVNGANDPYGNAAFTGTLIGAGVVAIAGFTVGGILLRKSAKGPLAIRPGIDPQPSSSSAFVSPFSFTF